VPQSIVTESHRLVNPFLLDFSRFRVPQNPPLQPPRLSCILDPAKADEDTNGKQAAEKLPRNPAKNG